MLSVPGGLDRRLSVPAGVGQNVVSRYLGEWSRMLSVPGGVGQKVISTWGSGAESCQYLGGIGGGGVGRREYVSQTIIQFIIL